ncbi:2-hydroxyhepta-2,4-diene-1,7-dioate isomerase, partial [Salipiger sp. HF18]
MKLMRVGPKGQERPTLVDAEGTIRDLSGVVPDFAGEGVSLEALDRIRALDPVTLPALPEGARIGACLASVPTFHCIGLNYAKHAAETGGKPPREPILFTKASSSLSGPNDAVILPPGSEKSDWEVELGVVIGK